MCKGAPKPEFGSERGICVFGHSVPDGNPLWKLAIPNGSPTETLLPETVNTSTLTAGLPTHLPIKCGMDFVRQAGGDDRL